MKKVVVLIALLGPLTAFASMFDEAALLGTQPTLEVLEKAARLPWPLPGETLERALVERHTDLSAEARRVWALDRVLPLLAGELEAPEETWLSIIRVLSTGTHHDASIRHLDAGRLKYADGRFQEAEAHYSKVRKESSLWADALRERAWTLYRLQRPAEALGASVTLRAPWFAIEDNAEARLLEAGVLLERCRYAEARQKAESIATQSGAPRPDPLVERLRRLLLDAPASKEGRARWEAVRARAETLDSRRRADEEAGRKAIARRALAVVYESLRAERVLRESGGMPRSPAPVKGEALSDDEVAWTFEGRYWRDELGQYRYVAADACVPEAKP